MSELLARHRAVIPNWVATYYQEPIELVSGKGCRVTDAAGHSYLDFFGGILTNMLGYDVPEVREAVERQIASGIVHTSTLYLIRNQVELAEKIARLSGIENAKVFFTNSGSEANEVGPFPPFSNWHISSGCDCCHQRAPVTPTCGRK